MSATLWIGGIALMVLVAGWRLHRAARTLHRILTEESERTIAEPPVPTEDASRPT